MSALAQLLPTGLTMKQAMWLQGNPRHFLGPNVTALVPLNLLAATSTHSHSDAEMRILHGYSDLGIVFGVYGAVVLLLLQSNVLKKLLFALLLVGNIAFFVVNTWITMNGICITFGSQFHLALSAIFCGQLLFEQSHISQLYKLS
tara:strand:+ start:519 stop:953 length:435 start_codon:yes stop_codon:yes gene_type:complete